MYFLSLAKRGSRTKGTASCLNPSHATSPRIYLLDSRRSTSSSVTLRDISRKSPVSTGMSTSESQCWIR